MIGSFIRRVPALVILGSALSLLAQAAPPAER